MTTHRQSSPPTRRRRWASLLVWFGGCVLAALLLGRGLLAWVGADPQRLDQLIDLGDSPWLMAVRLALYAGLWFGWQRLLRWFDPKVPASLVRRSRRPLLVLMIGYELLFGQNLLSFSI